MLNFWVAVVVFIDSFAQHIIISHRAITITNTKHCFPQYGIFYFSALCGIGIPQYVINNAFLSLFLYHSSFPAHRYRPRIENHSHRYPQRIFAVRTKSKFANVILRRFYLAQYKCNARDRCAPNPKQRSEYDDGRADAERRFH